MNALYPTTRSEWSPVSKISREAAEHFANLFRQHYPSWADRCDGRIQRAVKICTTPGACKRDPQDINLYLVRSQSNPRGYYVVNVQARTCTCPDDGRNKDAPRVICKHRLAIAFHLLGPQWSAEQTRQRIDRNFELSRLEDQRFELVEKISELAHQCRHKPELRTRENRDQLVNLFDQAFKVQLQIDELLAIQGGE